MRDPEHIVCIDTTLDSERGEFQPCSVAGNWASPQCISSVLGVQITPPVRRESVATVRQEGLSAGQMQRLHAYVEQNIGSRIRTIDLAASLGLSVSHFSRIFKQASGLTPRLFIVRKRIAHACVMMRAGDLPLTEIAHAHGFCDQSHFTRTFHQQMDVSPHVWRKLACNDTRD